MVWCAAKKAETDDLPDPSAAPMEAGAFLLTPLASIDPKLAALMSAHQLTHAAFSSPRPWIDEGLAHFAQVLYLERQSGRQAALVWGGAGRPPLAGMVSTRNVRGDARQRSITWDCTGPPSAPLRKKKKSR